MKSLQIEEPTVTFLMHPAANIFPMMSDSEAKDLMIDIRENGQREPITLFEGKVIDGRNRLRALRWLEIEPKVQHFKGTESEVVNYVLSLNLHRRHLTESQRAMVASKLAKQTQGGDRRSDQRANLPLETTNSQAAEMLNVSERSVGLGFRPVC